MNVMSAARLACVLLIFAVAGCTTVRPRATPAAQQTLPRPLVVIGGFGETGWSATYIGRWMKTHGGDRRVIGVSPGFAVTFDGAAELVVEAVQRYFPSDDPTRTVAVDVIGNSMGGVVARHAAAPGGGFGRRLDVQNLYTISSPNSGAVEADFFGPLAFGTARAMQTGSPFLARLAVREQLQTATRYPVTAYARDRDHTVGAGVALPPHLRGQLIYLPVAWYNRSSHSFAYTDGRILNDVLRRLREESPDQSPPG